MFECFLEEYAEREQELQELSKDKQAIGWGFTEEAKKVNDLTVVKDCVIAHL